MSLISFFFGRDNQAQIRPCGSRTDFVFSVTAGQLGRIRASGVKKVERVFFRPCRPNVKRPNRFIKPQAGLCGLGELGLSGRERDLSPGRPFSTKIRPYRPKKGLLLTRVRSAFSRCVHGFTTKTQGRHIMRLPCVFPAKSN